jgi:hypothetical protein
MGWSKYIAMIDLVEDGDKWWAAVRRVLNIWV